MNYRMLHGHKFVIILDVTILPHETWPAKLPIANVCTRFTEHLSI